jgi:hypothetical protein
MELSNVGTKERKLYVQWRYLFLLGQDWLPSLKEALNILFTQANGLCL